MSQGGHPVLTLQNFVKKVHNSLTYSMKSTCLELEIQFSKPISEHFKIFQNIVMECETQTFTVKSVNFGPVRSRSKSKRIDTLFLMFQFTRILFPSLPRKDNRQQHLVGRSELIRLTHMLITS